MIRARKHPFEQDFVECRARGLSLREIISNDSDAYLVVVDGEPVPASRWSSVVPSDESIVWITPLPQDDLGQALSLIATIALFAVAGPVGSFLSTSLGIGSASFWTGVTYGVGALAISALFPPPVPNLGGRETRRELKAVSGTRNRFAFYEPIPEIAGKHRVFPPYAAKPYTEIVGDDQYFNALFCVGLGEYNITEAKIGETLLTAYDGVTIEQTTDPNWLSITEDAFDIALDDPFDPESPTTSATRTTAVDVEFISVDFIAPAGLIYTRRDGKRRPTAIDFMVEYRVAGSGDPWTNVIGTTSGGFDWIGWTRGNNDVLGTPGASLPDHVGPITISPDDPTHFRVREQTINAVRFGMKWPVAEGQYEVRVTRTQLTNFGSPGALEDVSVSERAETLARYLQIFKWTVLRSHNTDTDAVALPADTATFLRLRIKANDQLNGIIERLNLVAERKLRTWDKVGQTFTAPAATRNPAWFALNVLTGPGNARAITSESSRIWLDDFADWATANETAGRKYDRIIESQTSVFEELSRCAATGRAAPVMRDARHTIVREAQGASPSGILTTRNSRNFSSSRTFITLPHAFRVRFISESAGYDEDEIIVYDDGYNAGNATLFETLRLEGITDPDIAWKFGRYHLAQLRLRPERYECELDFEHLTFIRGDQLLIQQDVLLFGIGPGRIIDKQGSLIILDERFLIEPGKTYAVNIRSIDGAGAVSIHNSTVTADPGTNVQRFTLATDNADVKKGDLVIVGVSGQETIPVKVLGIQPQQNLSARVTFVDAAPEILTADTGEIPAYNPNITLPRRPEDLQPPVPTITDVSSETNLNVVQETGDRTARMIISIRVETYQGLGIASLEARIRVKTTGQDSPWLILPAVGARSGSISTTEVEVEETYEIQARSISAYGIPSDWTATTEHQVGQATIPPPAVDGLTVTGIPGAVKVDANLSSIDIIDAAQLEIAYNTINDRDDAGTVIQTSPLPQKLENIAAHIDEVPFSDTTQRFFWVRLVDKYQNAGDWFPSGATAGLAATPTSAAGVPGLDGTLKEFVFRRAATQPATPTGDGIPPGWSDDPPGGANPLWFSTAEQQLDGTLIGSWSTPRRLDSQGAGNALNIGRRMSSLDEWFREDTQLNPLSTEAAFSIISLADEPIWDTTLEYDSDGNSNFFSERLTIDSSKKYRASVWAEQIGAGTVYLLIAFFDNNGDRINGGGSGATGWGGLGTYFTGNGSIRRSARTGRSTSPHSAVTRLQRSPPAPYRWRSAL